MDWSYWGPRLIERAGISVKVSAFIWFCFFVFDIPLLLALFGDHLPVFFAIVVGAALMGGMLWHCGELLKRKGALAKEAALAEQEKRILLERAPKGGLVIAAQRPINRDA
jgi:hypothetical protein